MTKSQSNTETSLAGQDNFPKHKQKKIQILIALGNLYDPIEGKLIL